MLKFFDLGSRRTTEIRKLEKRPFNAGLSLSPDGRWFLYTQLDATDTDLMLVEGVR